MITYFKNYIPKKREPIWIKFWEKNKIFKFETKSQKSVFSIDTPPPYVSAEHLHVGHVMSYSQAEFIAHFMRMRGYNVFYPMGFDDNGLPTERFVEKKYQIDKSKISRKEFTKLCLRETKIGAKIYKKLWQRLGISVDWSKIYSTINPLCQKIAQWSFIDLYKKGLIERREEPIYWCVSCQTSLSQADLEDKEEKSYLNFIEFKIAGTNQFLSIATTRPELLPACVAVFFHPNDQRYQNLKKEKIEVPIFNQKVPILTDESVDPNFGTGLMMVCTWGDNDDILKWKKHNLATRSLFNQDGKLNRLAGPYQGLTIQEAREKILKDLEKIGLLKKKEEIIHTLNVHDRCGTPVEFIQTKQWFIKILNRKDELLKRGGELKWYPKTMKIKYDDWIKSLKWDWNISRQRYYGVPFPVWYCKNCNEIILPKERDLPVDPREEKPKIKKCPKCFSSEFISEGDVMDTWMTSSMTPVIISALVNKSKFNPKKPPKQLYPTSLRPQAFEIIRTWLFYTVLKSHYHHNLLPFQDVMISGHGLDPKGKKISKRLGNYIDPQKIIDQYGADALRYWTTSATLGENLKYSEEEVKMGKRTIIKLWNASRFVIMHLKKFKPATKSTEKMEPMDQWILNELYDTTKQATKYLENYEYSKARNVIEKFFWRDFADNYLEFVKYRLYGYKQGSTEAAKKTLYLVLLNILKFYAPFLPFITEEIYQSFFRNFEKKKSIHLCQWPELEEGCKINKKLKEEFEKILKIVEEIRKYKSKGKISLATEIEEFRVPFDVNLKMHKEFLQKTFKIKKIIREN